MDEGSTPSISTKKPLFSGFFFVVFKKNLTFESNLQRILIHEKIFTYFIVNHWFNNYIKRSMG